MTMVTNLQHFLGENGEVPSDLTPEADALLSFLSLVVEAATIAYDKPVTFASAPCRAIVEGKRCEGQIEAWVYADTNEIGWECLECGEEGVITGWEKTAWDRRDYVRH